MRGSEFPYGNYQIKTGITYDSNKYVKYDDLTFELDPGVQSAGTYLLSNGSILSHDATLTTEQNSMVRALSIGDITDGVSRWIACGGGFTSIPEYEWCTTYPVSYDTVPKYVTDKDTALIWKNGKGRANFILNSATSHGYDFTYFPALNYCYSFDFGIIGDSLGDGYCMAPGEHQWWMNQPIIWTNWKKVTGTDLLGDSGSDKSYWSCLQHSAYSSWVVSAYNSHYYSTYDIRVSSSFLVLPAIQFS